MPTSAAPTPERAHLQHSNTKKQLKLRRLFPDGSASRKSDQRSLFADECVQEELTRPMDTRALFQQRNTATTTGQFANFEAAEAASCIAGVGDPNNDINATSSGTAGKKATSTIHKTPPRHPPATIHKTNSKSSGALALQPSARDSRKKRRPFGTPTRKQSEHDPPGGTAAGSATASVSVVNTSPPSGSSRKPIVVERTPPKNSSQNAKQSASSPLVPQFPSPQQPTNNTASSNRSTINNKQSGENDYNYDDDSDNIFDDVGDDDHDNAVQVPIPGYNNHRNNNSHSSNNNKYAPSAVTTTTDHDSGYGDDDSTAVAGTASMPSTVQHVSPLSSSLVLDPPQTRLSSSPKQQQQQQQQQQQSPNVVRKPIPSRPPASPGDAASSTLSDLTASYAESSRPSQQRQPQQQTTVFAKPSPQRPAGAPPPLPPTRQNNNSNSNKSQQQLTSSVKSSTSNASSSHYRPSSPLLKAALARPFERTPARHSWVVEVSSAEWDTDEKRWKYRILVQKRAPAPTSQVTATAETPIASSTSFTTAFTWRSVADFFWLEGALRKEYQGALLLPLLSVALGRTSATASEMPVESEKLKHWLADVLNGVRGAGEWTLPIQNNQQQAEKKMPQVDVMRCESVETFLYRHTVGSTLEDEQEKEAEKSARAAQRATTPQFQCGSTAQRLRCADDTTRHDDDEEMEQPSQCVGAPPSSFFQSLVETMLVAPLELCAGPQHVSTRRGSGSGSDSSNPSIMFQSGSTKANLSREVLNASSEALGNAKDLRVNDSFLDADASSVMDSLRGESGELTMMHTELLDAEKELSVNYRRSALQALDKLHTLHDEEEKLGAAWKRFAVCLSNLFAHEKDVEQISFGEKIKKDQMPYRKVDKKAVDDCLRDLARYKTERSTPGLVSLSAMLHAYVADLSSVQPAVDYFAKSLSSFVTATAEKPPGSLATSSVSSSTTSARDPLQAANKGGWGELKEWTLHSLNRATGGTAATDSGVPPNASDESSTPEMMRQQMLVKQDGDRKRLLGNEKLLRISLTTMFRTTPFRVSRMAWRYWHTEASQCALLNSAAAALRSELDGGVSKSSVSKMLKRHTKEEKADCSAELDLIQRIVNLGKWKKFAGSGESQTDGSVTTASIENELIGVDNEELNEGRSMAILRDEALELARQRIGRWDAALATAVLKAVGVSDPNVRVEETTKDLRLVRKYAIGLRENVDRCLDSVRLLRQAVEGKNKKNNVSDSTPLPFPKESDSNQQQQSQLRICRNEFLDDLCILFSATFVRVENSKEKRFAASKAVLTNAGINTSDPYGWIPAAAAATQKNRRATLLSQGRVGDLAVRYVTARDAQVEWLLGSMEGLLKEYYLRVEAIESFVFMESLGILLEKHFSAKRAKALSSFEKKTDLTAAINVATRKRMKKLIAELQGKMDRLGPEVSHTTVKETKDAHLESKALKNDLHELAVRRLTRAREGSTERAISIMSLWSKEEEIQAAEELKAVGEAMATLERLVCTEDFEGG